MFNSYEGFTERNLRNFRRFYFMFPIRNALRTKSEKIPIRHALRDQSLDQITNIRSELSWTHYRLLLKVEKEDIRKFYLEECIRNNWSTRQLERQINSFYYERILSSRNKDILRKNSRATEPDFRPDDIIKDPYVLEFLNLKENKNFLESDLEQGLIDKLQYFLLELGTGFSFVDRQKRITVEGDHFYIDLVFYNYILKCFILMDLKVGKLTHKDIGQMDFYVRYYEEEMKRSGDNPTIGLVLCSEKNEAMVKYTLLKKSRQIFASKYKLYLPTEKQLKAELERERQILELELGDK